MHFLASRRPESRTAASENPVRVAGIYWTVSLNRTQDGARHLSTPGSDNSSRYRSVRINSFSGTKVCGTRRCSESVWYSSETYKNRRNQHFAAAQNSHRVISPTLSPVNHSQIRVPSSQLANC
jgi:hypothetical protein